MGYETVALLDIDGKIWAVARGEACGDYPADPYDSDILAVKFDPNGKTEEQILEELCEEIAMSDYFTNSLIYGMRNGTVRVNIYGKFGSMMKEILKPRIKEFIAQKPEYDTGYILVTTLTPICRRSLRWKPEFVDFLASGIEKVLREF